MATKSIRLAFRLRQIFSREVKPLKFFLAAIEYKKYVIEHTYSSVSMLEYSCCKTSVRVLLFNKQDKVSGILKDKKRMFKFS